MNLREFEFLADPLQMGVSHRVTGHMVLQCILPVKELAMDFTLRNTANEVDQIRFQMWDADQNNLLYEYFVDVAYDFSSHCITMTSINPSSPGSLTTGENINFTFDYSTNEPSGVRIFGRPFTNGSITPGYSAHPSPINPTGVGSNTGFFTLNNPGNVDQIRFQIWDADQNNLLREYFIGVDYEFND